MIFQKKNSGFSLMETLIYLGVFGLISAAVAGILWNTIRVTTNQQAANEVNENVNRIISVVGDKVKNSANIESAGTNSLILKMSGYVNGVFSVSDGVLYYQEGSGAQTSVISEKVKIDSLTFTKISMSGTKGGVRINLVVSYRDNGNKNLVFQKSAITTINRSGSIAFSEDLLPDSNNVRSFGSSENKWKNAYFSGNLNSGADISGSRWCFGSDCRASWSSISGITGSGTTNYLAKWSSNSALTNSLLTDDGTNVKLITSSSTGFQVYPSGYPSQALYLYGGREATDSLARVWSDGPINIATKDGTNGYILFSSGVSGTSSGTELMRIKANGNVGINNNNPSEKLDVAGNIQLGQYNGVKMKNASSTVFTAISSDSANRILLKNPLDGTNVLVMTYTNRLAVGTTSPGVRFEVYGNTNQTKWRLYSTGDGGTNTSVFYLWASEPSLTYTGAGMGNNAYNGSSGITRSITSRGGSYVRLLDNNIKFNVIDSSGTDTNAINIASGGSVTIPGNLVINGTFNGGFPSGSIAMFDASCPSGWTRVSAWDGKVIRGASSYGGTGGSATHQHSIDPPATDSGSQSASITAANGTTGSYTDNSHNHSLDISAFDSASASTTPPFVEIIFCKKD